MVFYLSNSLQKNCMSPAVFWAPDTPWIGGLRRRSCNNSFRRLHRRRRRFSWAPSSLSTGGLPRRSCSKIYCRQIHAPFWVQCNHEIDGQIGYSCSRHVLRLSRPCRRPASWAPDSLWKGGRSLRNCSSSFRRPLLLRRRRPTSLAPSSRGIDGPFRRSCNNSCRLLLRRRRRCSSPSLNRCPYALWYMGVLLN